MRSQLLLLVVIGIVFATCANAAEVDERRTIEEQRDQETRAHVAELLSETNRQPSKLHTDPSLTQISLRFDASVFQEEEEESIPTPEGAIDYDNDGDIDQDDLARAAQNPIASMISLPFQNNLNLSVGELDYNQNVLNIQPVIPFSLSEDWNLITRTIVPVIYQPALFDGDDHDFGVSDVQFTTWLSPKKPIGGWIIGAGPVLQFPTATDERLGARKWTAGPSVVVLRMDGPWVYGGLVQQVWSYAGSGDKSVNQLLFQPFVNYNMAGGWYLVSSPILTSNWNADSNDQWTIPVGGGVGKIFRIGQQPMNVSVQGFYNVETPDLGPDWTIRLQLQFLFPR